MRRETTPRPPRRRWPVGLALGAALLAGAVWRFAGGSGSATDAVLVASPATPPAAVAATGLLPREARAVDATSTLATSPSAAPVAIAESPPAGISAEQWASLREDLKDHPQRSAEIRRVAEFMDYMNATQRFQALQAAAHHGPELQQLARVLDAGLATRLQRQEVSLGEARLLKLAITQALEPDASRRDMQLAEWRAATEAVLAQSATTVASDAKAADYERLQAAAVAAWQALPLNQRDSKQLESQLDALRVAAFPSLPRVPNVPNSRPNAGPAPGGSP